MKRKTAAVIVVFAWVLLCWQPASAQTGSAMIEKRTDITVRLMQGQKITPNELEFIEQAQFWQGVRSGLRAAYGVQTGDACDPPKPTTMHAAYMDGSLMAFAKKRFGENADYVGLGIIAIEWLREQRPGCYPGPRWR